MLRLNCVLTPKLNTHMSHSALEIDNWENIGSSFSYNHYSSYDGLNIDAAKLYYYLKEKFGKSTVSYSLFSKYFPERKFVLPNVWCYLFRYNSYYVVITGDDKINIAVFSSTDVPSNLDYEIFSNNMNEILKRISLEKYVENSYEVYVNYSFYLKNIISEYKKSISKKLPQAPEQISLNHEDINAENPEIKYKYIEFGKDYNEWLKAVLEKSQSSLMVQILLPIHFETLINLAFRVKLKKEYRSDEKIFGNDPERRLDIYQFFERLTVPKKIEQIKEKCFEVDRDKINQFLKLLRSSYELREKRNKYLHGNALYFQNLHLKYLVDDNYLIGFPDRGRAMRAIASSISVTTEDKNIISTIKIYEELCEQFKSIFNDNNYFRKLVEGLAFLHNSNYGGTVSIGVNKYEDLFAPLDLK